MCFHMFQLFHISNVSKNSTSAQLNTSSHVSHNVWTIDQWKWTIAIRRRCALTLDWYSYRYIGKNDPYQVHPIKRMIKSMLTISLRHKSNLAGHPLVLWEHPNKITLHWHEPCHKYRISTYANDIHLNLNFMCLLHTVYLKSEFDPFLSQTQQDTFLVHSSYPTAYAINESHSREITCLFSSSVLLIGQ